MMRVGLALSVEGPRSKDVCGGPGGEERERWCRDGWADGCLSVPTLLVPIYAAVPL